MKAERQQQRLPAASVVLDTKVNGEALAVMRTELSVPKLCATFNLHFPRLDQLFRLLLANSSRPKRPAPWNSDEAYSPRESMHQYNYCGVVRYNCKPT
jgi:hypothetical protein